jgi:RNA polymerase sigma-70 factor, ECF subfamily
MVRWPWKRERDSNRRAEFEALAREHADDIYSAARRMTRNCDDADDLAQNTIVRAYSQFDRFATGTNFKAWVLRILTNLYISDLRRKRLATMVPLEPEIEESLQFVEVPSSFGTPGFALISEALDEDITRALDSLGDGVRLCVILVDVEELSYEDTASALGVPVGTVRSRLNRGREQLKKALAEYARNKNIV